MQLLELNIDGYKNIKSTIPFEKNNGLTLVVGTNGSGKSNLLEAISAIFSALYEGKSKVTPNFKFDLLYKKQKPTELVDENVGSDILVRIYNADEQISVCYGAEGAQPTTMVSEKDVNMFLPDHVVAIYSGEETRLWNNYYFSSYDSYNKQYMSGKTAYRQQRMVYFNHYYWNLLASILAIDEIEDHRNFLLEKIGLCDINGIHMEFDIDKIKKNKNEMAQRIVTILNPNMEKEVEVDLETFREVRAMCGYEKELLFHMAVLLLHKNFKIITEFKLLCNNGIQVEELSEGEKKILLIYGAINITTGENLYLFDEPDAHLHEGRKKEIYDLLCSDVKSQFVISSHSPTMTQMFNIENVLFAQNSGDGGRFENDEVSQIISKLTNNDWKYIEQTLFMEINRPLVLVEGDGDVKYMKKAIDVISKVESHYRQLQTVDFLHCGGANNIPHTVEQLKTVLPSGKIVIAIFDRDAEGLNGAKKIINREIDTTNDRTYKKDSLYVFMLPITDGYTFSSFVIEDYFKNTYKKQVVLDKLNSLDGNFNEFLDIKKYLKSELGNRLSSYGIDELGGFKVLLDKIISIINGNESIIEI